MHLPIFGHIGQRCPPRNRRLYQLHQVRCKQYVQLRRLIYNSVEAAKNLMPHLNKFHPCMTTDSIATRWEWELGENPLLLDYEYESIRRYVKPNPFQHAACWMLDAQRCEGSLPRQTYNFVRQPAFINACNAPGIASLVGRSEKVLRAHAT